MVGLDRPRNAHHRLLSTLLQDSDHSRRTIFCSKNYLETNFFNWWVFSEVRQNSVKCFFARRCVSGNCCPLYLYFTQQSGCSILGSVGAFTAKCLTKTGLKLNCRELIALTQCRFTKTIEIRFLPSLLY